MLKKTSTFMHHYFEVQRRLKALPLERWNPLILLKEAIPDSTLANNPHDAVVKTYSTQTLPAKSQGVPCKFPSR